MHCGWGCSARRSPSTNERSRRIADARQPLALAAAEQTPGDAPRPPAGSRAPPRPPRASALDSVRAPSTAQPGRGGALERGHLDTGLDHQPRRNGFGEPGEGGARQPLERFGLRLVAAQEERPARVGRGAERSDEGRHPAQHDAFAEIERSEIREAAIVERRRSLRRVRLELRRIAREQPRQTHEPRRVEAPHPGNRCDTEQPARIDGVDPAAVDLGGNDGSQRQQLIAQPELVHPREQLAIGARNQRAGRLEAEAVERIAHRPAARARRAFEHAHVEAEARQAPGCAEAGNPGADHDDPAVGSFHVSCRPRRAGARGGDHVEQRLEGLERDAASRQLARERILRERNVRGERATQIGDAAVADVHRVAPG